MPKQQSESFFIARHGETEWNRDGIYQGVLDSRLTEAGWEHANSLAQFFKTKQLSVIYSSPLGRCQATAQVIAEATGVELVVVEDFQEMNFGEFQGRYKEEVLVHSFFEQRKIDKLNTPFPGGESYQDISNRVDQPMRKIISADNGTPRLIVGHESVNRILRSVLTGIPLTEAVKNKQPHTQVVEYDFKNNKEMIHHL